MSQRFLITILVAGILLQISVVTILCYGLTFLGISRSWIALIFLGLNGIWTVSILNQISWKKKHKNKPGTTTLTSSLILFSSFIANLFFLFMFCILVILFNSPNTKNADNEDKVCAYFDSIKGNENALVAFFASMPKGGDLHHHFTGSVFAETYWNALVKSNGWVNLITYETDTAGAKKGAGWKTCKQIEECGELANCRQKVLQQWSIKDFSNAVGPNDKHFFDAFGKFRLFANKLTEDGLLEIKGRAISEGVSYIETMLTSFDTSIVLPDERALNNKFSSFNTNDRKNLIILFDSLRSQYISRNAISAVNTFCRKLEQVHARLGLDDSLFTLRYLTYTNRTAAPLQIFRRLLLAFEAADRDSLIVGVNFVAPEDNEVSMKDYFLHMLMFSFFHSCYSNVRISLHAGELAPGLVKPEDLKYHIKDAVFIGHANRIGHGVDIAYENDYQATLRYMSANKVAVEINLVSNEFILQVKNDAHPILLYKKYDVPIVISTDDAGILRTDLTRQFVLLVKRYSSVSYADIKQFTRNSIMYSFNKNASEKARILSNLNRSFQVFEKNVAESIRN